MEKIKNRIINKCPCLLLKVMGFYFYSVIYTRILNKLEYVLLNFKLILVLNTIRILSK